MSALIVIESESQLKEIIENTDRVLVDFYADWCGPCKMMMPLLEDLQDIVAGKFTFVKVNVNDLSELTSEYKIRNIPSLLLFQNGQQIASHSGSMTKIELLRFISNAK